MADIDIKGLRELLRATNNIQKEFPDELTEAAADVARMVVSGARSAATSPMARLAASSLSAGRNGAAGTVTASAPFFAGAEFGGGNRPTTKQFPPYRGQRGYFLYPSMRAQSGRLNDRWDTAIEKVMSVWDYKPGSI